MRRLRLALAALVLLWRAGPAAATGYQPDRGTAPLIVVGKVEGVEEWWSLSADAYRVRVRVTEVERGFGHAPGEVVTVRATRSARLGMFSMGCRSENATPPDVGETVRVFAWPEDGGYRGHYSEWYDRLAPSDRGWVARQWAHRSTRLLCYVAAVAAVGVAGLWLRPGRPRREAAAAEGPPPAP